MAEKRFYSVNETAQIFGVSSHTVYRWLQQGKFPHVKMSARTIRIPIEAVDELPLT